MSNISLQLYVSIKYGLDYSVLYDGNGLFRSIEDILAKQGARNDPFYEFCENWTIWHCDDSHSNILGSAKTFEYDRDTLIVISPMCFAGALASAKNDREISTSLSNLREHFGNDSIVLTLGTLA